MKKFFRFQIGLRTIKTAVAVIISMLLVDHLGTSSSKLIFAMLGAMAAVQPNFKSSLESCLTQIVGANPSIIVDTNHNNSGKKYLEQIRIAKDIVHSRNENPDIKRLVKGLMIESYLEDGAQGAGEHAFGKSITDPCLGWEKTERLIYDIVDKL